MPLVVTGLLQNRDMSAVENALRAAGLSTEPLEVIRPDDVARPRGGLAGTGLLTSEGGTGVPGLSHSSPATFFNDDGATTSRLSDLEIPDSEIGNYMEALERGRSVVAYYAHADTVEQVEAAFRDAALANVRRY